MRGVVLYLEINFKPLASLAPDHVAWAPGAAVLVHADPGVKQPINEFIGCDYFDKLIAKNKTTFSATFVTRS